MEKFRTDSHLHVMNHDHPVVAPTNLAYDMSNDSDAVSSTMNEPLNEYEYEWMNQRYERVMLF
jgi:uncharacterized protein YdaL